jgi:hypothetical protein
MWKLIDLKINKIVYLGFYFFEQTCIFENIEANLVRVKRDGFIIKSGSSYIDICLAL